MVLKKRATFRSTKYLLINHLSPNSRNQTKKPPAKAENPSSNTSPHNNCRCLSQNGALKTKAWVEEGLGGLPLTTKLLATNRLREDGSHCLQLSIHWIVHQAPTDSSNPMVTQTAMIKLNGPQNQAKNQESLKGTGRKEQKVVKEGRR